MFNEIYLTAIAHVMAVIATHDQREITYFHQY